MNRSFRILAAVLTVALLAVIPATAELADGTETLTLENGLSFTYNRYDYRIDVEEDGTVAGVYLGEAPEPVGFNIVNAEGTDAEAYISEAAESYGLGYFTGSFFAENDEWHKLETLTEDGDYICQRVVFTRNNDTGCRIVTVYSYYPINDEDEKAGPSQVRSTKNSSLFSTRCHSVNDPIGKPLPPSRSSIGWRKGLLRPFLDLLHRTVKL